VHQLLISNNNVVEVPAHSTECPLVWLLLSLTIYLCVLGRTDVSGC